MIFETERLQVRELNLNDLDAFHEMQSNPNVLRYADGKVKSKSEHLEELKELIRKYNSVKRDFLIYAIENKQSKLFLGTVALVKNNLDAEIGYRFLEKYWNNGYGYEVCKGLTVFCKKLKLQKIVGFVILKNIASKRILEKLDFRIIDTFTNSEGEKEYKYELEL